MAESPREQVSLFAREALLEGEEKGMRAGLSLERESFTRLTETDEMAEGLLAFNKTT